MTQIDMRQLQENIRGVISNLQALGELEDGRAELAKVQREVERLTHNNKVLDHEIAEKQALLKSIERKVEEKDRKHDQLLAQIRDATAQRDKIVSDVAALRQKHFGG